MSTETIYNRSERPEPIDETGRTVDAASWATVDTSEPSVVDRIDWGYFTVVETPNPVPEDLNPAAAAAFAQTLTARGEDQLPTAPPAEDETPTPKKAAAHRARRPAADTTDKE